MKQIFRSMFKAQKRLPQNILESDKKSTVYSRRL